jgi:cysteine-rich secretory family protein
MNTWGNWRQLARGLLVGASLSIVSSTVAVAIPQVLPSGGGLKLFDLLNREREKAGLRELQWDKHLAESAAAHAHLLAEHLQLSHQFEGERELVGRVGATGLRFDTAGENVASAATVEEAHRALMSSPPHRANILNPEYNAVGLAVVQRKDVFFIAQNFAHVLRVYSEKQFREGVIAAFNSARRTSGIAEIAAQADPRLREAACSEDSDRKKLLQELPGATLLEVFTSSVPEKLPPHMQKTAADPKLKRMRIGVCFKPGKEHGYASFQAIAVFYPQKP